MPAQRQEQRDLPQTLRSKQLAEDAVTPVDSVAQVELSPAGPQIGAFFDLDGTLVDGFTATAHAGDRIRRRQARIGEVTGVIEAAMRYKFGRVNFAKLLE